PLLHGGVDRIITERRAKQITGADVLGVMLDARYDDGSAMADAEIRDQVWTLLAAGHETTAVAMAWGVYWLLREPAVLARLRAEVGALGSEAAPQGDVVMVNVGAILDDAAVFREPERFQPERFLENSFGATQFLPFGGGS